MKIRKILCTAVKEGEEKHIIYKKKKRKREAMIFHSPCTEGKKLK